MASQGKGTSWTCLLQNEFISSTRRKYKITAIELHDRFNNPFYFYPQVFHSDFKTEYTFLIITQIRHKKGRCKK